jgi:hypothetical protein
MLRTYEAPLTPANEVWEGQSGREPNPRLWGACAYTTDPYRKQAFPRRGESGWGPLGSRRGTRGLLHNAVHAVKRARCYGGSLVVWNSEQNGHS